LANQEHYARAMRSFLQEVNKRSSREQILIRSFSQNDTRQISSNTESMVGDVLIRACKNSQKVMHVEFHAEHDKFKINLLQFVDGHTQVFELCNLNYEGLGSCWFWDNNEIFLIGALEKNTMFHEIYCWPLDATRNQWLNFLEKKKVRTMSVTDAKFENSRYFPRRLTKLPSIIENTSSKVIKNAQVTSFKRNEPVTFAKSSQTASANNQRLRRTTLEISCKKEIDNNPFSESMLVQKIFFSICCLLMMSLMLVNHYHS
jgi:hypothetical protein